MEVSVHANMARTDKKLKTNVYVFKDHMSTMENVSASKTSWLNLIVAHANPKDFTKRTKNACIVLSYANTVFKNHLTAYSFQFIFT